MCRHEALLGTTSDISPIHWQYGAIARLKKGEKIAQCIFQKYLTVDNDDATGKRIGGFGSTSKN